MRRHPVRGGFGGLDFKTTDPADRQFSAAGPDLNTQAKFLTGSTMRHVIVMTLTGSLGLSFMFLVEFLALWWVSQLDDELLITAIGFAGTIQFFVVSVAIGMMIGAVALVSRALGSGDGAEAKRIASSALVFAVTILAILSGAMFVYRHEILEMTGASGEALEVASDFLAITLPSVPFVAAGMCSSAILRALGDAWRSMMVTMVAGLLALVIDPILIIWMDLGALGAAISIVISRLGMTVLGLYWVIHTYKMFGRPSLVDMKFYMRPYLAIAIPAIATQVSTPFGNWVAVRAIAEHGDSAVAGLGVVMRLTMLLFGGIFALSGAIGGIIGQNYGARQMDRVASAYRDALVFCFIYTVVVWAVLALSAGFVVRSFGLHDDGADVVYLFSYYMAGAFVFTGALFVSNAGFNNLGRPLWATVANWLRDGVLMFPLTFGLGAVMGAGGVVTGNALANVVAGTFAALLAWRFIQRKRAGMAPAGGAAPHSPAMGAAGAKAATMAAHVSMPPAVQTPAAHSHETDAPKS